MYTFTQKDSMCRGVHLRSHSPRATAMVRPYQRYAFYPDIGRIELDRKERLMSQTTGWQRLEGISMMAGSLLLYATLGANWWLFALILLPDLAMVGYLLGNKAGQTLYNFAHTYAIPLLCAMGGYWLNNDLLLALGLIWVAHIGIDRALGYGLKEQAGFRYTHLGVIGAGRQSPSPSALPVEVS